MTHALVEPHDPTEVGPQSRPSTTVVAARAWLPAALAGVSGAVVIGLLLLLWFGVEQRDRGTVGESSVPLRQAPDFTLGLFDGGTFRLSDQLQQGQGRPVLVNFWASRCVPCVEVRWRGGALGLRAVPLGRRGGVPPSFRAARPGYLGPPPAPHLPPPPPAPGPPPPAPPLPSPHQTSPSLPQSRLPGRFRTATG